MTIRVSVTELEQYVECEVRHHRRYIQGLRLRQEKTVQALSIGSAVARAAELELMLGSAAPQTFIRYDVDEGIREKVQKCFDTWVEEVKIDGRVIAEDKLEVGYASYENQDNEVVLWEPHSFDPDLTVVGKPDIWYVEYEEGSGRGSDGPPEPMAVHVIDLKTTAQPNYVLGDMVADYNTFNLQTARYCVLLHDSFDWLQGLQFYQHHILISHKTGAIEGHNIGGLPVTNLDWVREEMLGLAAEAANKQFEKRRFSYGSFRCGRCDYKILCSAYLTGRDVNDIIEEEFTVKEVNA